MAISDQEDARTLINSARGFLRAAAILDAADDWLAYAPLSTLCHAIELTLKAHLRLRGVPQCELANRKLFGHDLQSLLHASLVQGLSLESTKETELCRIVNWVNAAHRSRDLGYLGPQAFGAPPVDVAMPAVQYLFDIVLQECSDALAIDLRTHL